MYILVHIFQLQRIHGNDGMSMGKFPGKGTSTDKKTLE